MTSHLQALVFGASGITGWAILREALSYPTSTTFDRIIGLTNRPLSKTDAQLGAEAIRDDRLQLVSGIDLTQSVDNIVKKLQTIEGGVNKITHVYFVAYIAHTEFAELAEHVRANVQLLEHAIRAMEQAAPNMQFVSLQTGGNTYGIVYSDKIKLNPPFRETDPRIPKPYADNIFYYPQCDLLEKMSVGKRWTFTEIIPDVIVGFVPNNNAMNIAQALGIFLCLYATINGPGAQIPFPGIQSAYDCRHNDTSQDILARLSIYASLHPDRTGTKKFNIADGSVVRWADVWPDVTAFFGLKGVGPDQENKDPTPMTSWVKAHESEWDALAKKHGLRNLFATTAWEFVQTFVGFFGFDRQYDLGAIRKIGFLEEVDTVKGYHIAFERMRQAKMIL